MIATTPYAPALATVLTTVFEDDFVKVVIKPQGLSTAVNLISVIYVLR